MTTTTATEAPPATAAELLNVPPAQIRPHAENLRHDLGDLADLASSIREQGVLEPLIVAPTGEDKTPYLLIAGHRRHAAAKKASVKTVPVVVRHDLDTLPAQLEAMLVENGHRASLTPVEEAEGYQQLLTFPGYTQAKVAKATGRSTRFVRDRLKLGELGAAARDLVHTGQVAMADAIALTEFADDEKTYTELEALLGTDQYAWKLQQARTRREREHAAAKTRRELQAAGVKVIDRPEGFPWQTRDTVAPLANDAGDGYDHYGLGVDFDEHAASCPAHAAVVDRDGEAVYVCTEATVRHRQPTLDAAPGEHPAEVNRPNSSPESSTRTPTLDPDAVAARQGEREQFAEDLRTAAALRRTFLDPFLTGERKLTHDQRQHAIRVLVQVSVGGELVLDDNLTSWLGVEGLDLSYEATGGHREPAVAAALAEVDPDRLLLGAAATQAEYFVSCGQPDEDGEDVHVYRVWYGLLADLGYQPAAFELDHLVPGPDDDTATDVDEAEGRPVEDVVEAL